MIRKSFLFTFYIFSLLVIPFYIGPELAKNFQLNVERILLVCICVFIIFKLFKKGTYRKISALQSRHKLFLYGFVVFFIWRGLSALNSTEMVSVFHFIYEFISNFLIFFVFYIFFFDKGYFDKFLEIVFLSVFVVFSFALLEFFLGRNVFASLAPADAGAAISSEAIIRGSVYRVKSVFEHPLTLGHFCVMTLPLILFLKNKSTYSVFSSKSFLSIAVILMAILTGSRMTMLCCTLILVIYLIIDGPKVKVKEGVTPRKASLFLWPFILSLPIIALLGVSMLSGRGSLDSYVRQAQIANGLQVIQMEPLFGFGQGPGGMVAIEKYGTAMKLWAQNAATIDNWFLSVLLSSGYPGLAFFILFNLFIIIELKSIYLNRFYYKSISSPYYNLWVSLVVSYSFGLMFMVILSIFTLHPFFYIIVAALLCTSAKLKSDGQEL